MKLDINGASYQVPEEYEQKIFDQLWHKEAVPWYERLDNAWKIGAMVISRGVLLFLEKQIEKETGDKEKARAVRPPQKGMDPNLWTGELLAKILLEGLKSVTIACETGVDAETGERQILAFNLQIDTPRAQPGIIVTQNTGEAR